MKKEEIIKLMESFGYKIIPYFKNYKTNDLETGIFDDGPELYISENGKDIDMDYEYASVNIQKLRDIIYDKVKGNKKIALLIDENLYYLQGVIAVISYCMYNNIDIIIIYKSKDDYAIQAVKSLAWYKMFNGGE